MLTGVKGVKYGLSLPKKPSKPALRKPVAGFGGDSDDEKQNVEKDIERQALKKRADVKVQQVHAAALAEDASVFDYDSHFDAIQEQREQPKIEAKQARKSRYIEGLLDKAKEREKEQDIIYERKLLRERKAEDHLFGDKDKYVTAAYKKKLEEDKKWLEEEAIKEKLEAEQDVRKRGHMGDFYRNLLSNNVAFGTAVPAASAAAKLKAEAPTAEAAAAQPAGPQDEAWEGARRARQAFEEGLANREAPIPNAAAPPTEPATQATPPARPPADLPEERSIPSSGRLLPEIAADRPDSGAATLGPLERVDGSALPGNDAPQKDGGDAKHTEEAAPVLSREDKAAAARERFLARKRKAPGAG